MFVPRCRTTADVSRVVALLGHDLSDYEIARRTGISRSTVQAWRKHGIPEKAAHAPLALKWRPRTPASYSYLLGIYLGDGYVANAESPTQRLEISLDAKYPRIVAECSAAIAEVALVEPTESIRRTKCGIAIRLATPGPFWTAAFPQHAPGKKHLRPIQLLDWQQRITAEFPKGFLRGLIHSDGSRVLNTVETKLSSGVRRYVYPRYFFTNLSTDIRRLFCASCEQLGIRWTQSSYKNISVADRRSVALLDTFVGPKR